MCPMLRQDVACDPHGVSLTLELNFTLANQVFIKGGKSLVVFAEF